MQHLFRIPPLGYNRSILSCKQQNLHLEIQKLKKYKETKPKVRAEVWCLKSKVQGNDKDHYLVYGNFVTRGGPIPLNPEAQVGPSVGVTLWCIICSRFQ